LAPHPRMLEAIERGPRGKTYCPVHGGKSGKAFKIEKDFAQSGHVRCNSCRARYGFGLLMWLNQWDVRTTAQRLGAYLDGQSSPSHPPPAIPRAPVPSPAPADERGKPREAVLALWDRAFPLGHPHAEPAQRYLTSRGLEGLPNLPNLRCHPHLPYYEEQSDGRWKLAGRFPTLLARLIGPDGRMVGLHRTYLTSEGAKAPVEVPKKVLAIRGLSLLGAAVPLGRSAAVLGVAEGLETALSVVLATGMPMAACTSTALMRALVVPSSVQRLVIWADFDVLTRLPNGRWLEPGREAAEALAARLRGEHRSVAILYPRIPLRSRLPERGVDWNDAWTRQGPSGFPTLTHWFRRASPPGPAAASR
jgi:putative DNA primase/helicase